MIKQTAQKIVYGESDKHQRDLLRGDWYQETGSNGSGQNCEVYEEPECKSHDGDDHTPTVEKLLTKYGPGQLDHPMTQTLTAALAETRPAQRRGGRAARLAR